MKKRLILISMLFLLTACNTAKDEVVPYDSEVVAVYSNEQSLIHNMEGVRLTIEYEVRKITGKVVESSSTSLSPGDFLLEMNGTIENNFERAIYYTPQFHIQTADGIEIERVSAKGEQQLTVNQDDTVSFQVTYSIPKALYRKVAELTLRIPAAFKEPNSESSGDALGDVANWQIPIK